MAIVSSVITGGSSNHATSSEEANAIGTDFVSQGVVGTFSSTSGVAPTTGAFAVNAQGSPNTTVAVSTGVAYVTATPSGQNSQLLRVKNSASANVTIAANSSGSTKYDHLYIAISSTNAANPNVAADNVASLTTSRSTSASTDDGTPPTYGLKIAVITVANGFSTITNGNIRDTRANALFTAGSDSTTSGWSSLGYTPNTVTYNGNRSYDLVFNSTDLTSTLSNGMRVRTTRVATAPIQCTSLNGTTQYYSKSSPAGMTFTDDFVAGAWIKLTSYTNAGIVSRFNGTSGWILSLNASGQPTLYGANAGGANFSQVVAYQSVPLNKWVHITAQLDMSSFTATPTTSYIMIDGVDVPASVGRGGTNPTALIQAGNLEIGSYNAGTNFFPGKIAQAFVTSAKVTQATIRSNYISQSISPTETSLISAYSFNNSINDLNTSNANNLTANGSAVATNADSPFTQDDTGVPGGSLDYAIITKKAFSTNTTLTVQVPEGCAIPTSGGVSAVSYSTQKSPFGFPEDEDKWNIYSISLSRYDNGSTANGVVANSGNWQILAPVGAWRGSLEGPMYINRGVAGTTDTRCNISTTAAGTTAIPNGLFNTFFYANIDASMWTRKEFNYTTATAQSLYVNLKNASGVTYSSMGWLSDFGQGTLMLRNVYL